MTIVLDNRQTSKITESNQSLVLVTSDSFLKVYTLFAYLFFHE